MSTNSVTHRSEEYSITIPGSPQKSAGFAQGAYSEVAKFFGLYGAHKNEQFDQQRLAIQQKHLQLLEEPCQGEKRLRCSAIWIVTAFSVLSIYAMTSRFLR